MRLKSVHVIQRDVIFTFDWSGRSHKMRLQRTEDVRDLSSVGVTHPQFWCSSHLLHRLLNKLSSSPGGLSLLRDDLWLAKSLFSSKSSCLVFTRVPHHHICLNVISSFRKKQLCWFRAGSHNDPTVTWHQCGSAQKVPNPRVQTSLHPAGAHAPPTAVHAFTYLRHRRQNFGPVRGSDEKGSVWPTKTS